MPIDKAAYCSEQPFALYYKRANEKVLLPHILASAIRSFHFVPRTILDIGCNDGRFAAELLGLLSDAFPVGCRYTGIDPCVSALERFRNGDFPHGIFIELRAESAEDLPSGEKGGSDVQRYDLTIVAHSIYWVRELDETVKRILDISEFVLFVVRGCRGIYSIQELFRDKVPSLEFNRYNADDLERVLKDRAVGYERLNVATEIALENIDDEEMRQLISFCLDSPLDVMGEAVVRDAMTLLLSYGDRITHDVSVFVVPPRR